MLHRTGRRQTNNLLKRDPVVALLKYRTVTGLRFKLRQRIAWTTHRKRDRLNRLGLREFKLNPALLRLVPQQEMQSSD